MTTVFTNNPAEYFGYDAFRAHQLPRSEVEALQMTMVQTRFAALFSSG